MVWLSETRAKRGGFSGEGFYVRDAIPGPDKKAKGPYPTKQEALDHIDGKSGKTRPSPKKS